MRDGVGTGTQGRVKFRGAAPEACQSIDSRAVTGVGGWALVLLVGLGLVFVLPWFVLLWLSVGSGWEWPRLWPQRVDGVAWQRAFSGSHLRALLQGAGLSLAVSLSSTAGGLLISRSFSYREGGRLRRLFFVPLLVSPVVAAGCLFDLLARLELAGTWVGVFLVQCVFGTAFAAVFLGGARVSGAERREQLVRALGGTSWAVWRHVVLPDVWRLLPLCLFQSALISWLDYGLTTVIGGGRVQTLMMRLFSQIREGSVAQAAASALLLSLPLLVVVLVLQFREGVRVRKSGTWVGLGGLVERAP